MKRSGREGEGKVEKGQKKSEREQAKERKKKNE
jgi:hypothetical protein